MGIARRENDKSLCIVSSFSGSSSILPYESCAHSLVSLTQLVNSKCMEFSNNNKNPSFIRHSIPMISYAKEPDTHRHRRFPKKIFPMAAHRKAQPKTLTKSH